MLLVLLWWFSAAGFFAFHNSFKSAQAKRVRDEKKICWLRIGRESMGLLMLGLPQLLPGPAIPLWMLIALIGAALLCLGNLYLDVRKLLSRPTGPELDSEPKQ